MNRLESSKTKYNVETSEEIFGITPPIGYQCPRIDLYIRDIKLISDHIANAMDNLSMITIPDSEEEWITRTQSELEHLSKYTTQLENNLESLRISCSTLRTWGDAWKLLAKEMFEKIPGYEKFILEALKKGDNGTK